MNFQPDDDDEFAQPPAGFGLPKPHVLIVAAGVGARAGGDVPKQYREIAGRTVLAHTVAVFDGMHAQLGRVAVVVSANDGWVQGALPAESSARLLRCGGATRADSVLNGLSELVERLDAHPDDWVMVHDAARCMLHADDVTRLIDACSNHAVGGLLAAPVPDTLKAEANDGCREVAHTLDRQGKWMAQTPQMFRLGALIDALEDALEHEPQAITDEASAMERAGLSPLLVAALHPNFKITYPQDFDMAETLLSARLPKSAQPTAPQLRIGQGWDVHALVPGRPLILGGVTIPHHLGLLGHSDADALLHAITDALLGAAGLGDIGTLFPDTDAQFKGADSQTLLKEAIRRVAARGYTAINADCTVIAQAPKLAAYKAQMATNIAACLSIDKSQVNVKAKTAEKLGPVGQEQSIEAQAVVLLRG